MSSTLTSREQSEAIRDRMQHVRSQLPHDADDARGRMRQLADWRYHMRKRPWPILAAAAIAAYLFVPDKSNTQRKETPRAAPRHDKQTDAGAKPLWHGLLGAMATMALRSGTLVAAQHLSQKLSGRHVANGRHVSADPIGDGGKQRTANERIK